MGQNLDGQTQDQEQDLNDNGDLSNEDLNNLNQGGEDQDNEDFEGDGDQDGVVDDQGGVTKPKFSEEQQAEVNKIVQNRVRKEAKKIALAEQERLNLQAENERMKKQYEPDLADQEYPAEVNPLDPDYDEKQAAWLDNVADIKAAKKIRADKVETANRNAVQKFQQDADNNTKNYVDNGKNCGLKEDELVDISQSLIDSGVQSDAAQYVCNTKKGPLVGKFLNDNPDAMDKLKKMAYPYERSRYLDELSKKLKPQNVQKKGPGESFEPDKSGVPKGNATKGYGGGSTIT